MATALEALDEVVREYLVFRGFFGALRAFDADLRAASAAVVLGERSSSSGSSSGAAAAASAVVGDAAERGVGSGGAGGAAAGGVAVSAAGMAVAVAPAAAGGFQVDRIVEALFATVAVYDVVALLELWSFLDARFFSRLEDVFFRTVKRFELCLLRHYLVNAYAHHRRDKIIEFFELCANDIGTESTDWQPWFALPFLKKAESDPYFEPFFSKTWLEVFSVSLQNFLQTVFHSLPLPALLSFNAERMRMRSLEAEIESLRRQVDLLTTELHMLVATIEGSSGGIVAPATAATTGVAAADRRVPAPTSIANIKHTSSSRRLGSSDGRSGADANQTSGGAKALRPKTLSSGSDTPVPVIASVPPSTTNEDTPAVAISTSGPGSDADSTDGDDIVPTTALVSQDVFADHDAPIIHTKFSAAGNLIMSVDSERTIRMWSPGTGKSMATLFKSQLPHTVTSLEWGSKSERLCFLGTDTNSLVRVFNTESRQFVHEFAPTPGVDPACPPIVCAMLSHPTEPVVVASYASTVPLFSVPAMPKRHTKGNLVSPLNKEGVVFGWNLRSFATKPSFALAVNNPVKALAFNHNGQLLAFGDSEGKISIFDMRSLTSVAEWPVQDNIDLLGLSFSFDETQVTSVTMDGKIAQWSLRTGHRLLGEGTLTTREVPPDPRVVFSADSALVLSTFSRPHATIHDVRSGHEIQAISGHSAAVLCADWSQARSSVITGSADRTVRLSKLLVSTGQ